ncbi:MAG TPA: universal stress protein [Puia sp.]|nr:universal stress protein [Puia sp.]
MKKEMIILVPTDFSAASRAGMRFALQWARQQRSKLLVTHVLDMIKYADWGDKSYEFFAEAQRASVNRRLAKVIHQVCGRANSPEKTCDSQVVEGTGVDRVLADMSRRRHIDLISMGTGGAGTLQKILGTVAGKLLLRSQAPVVVVPAGYRTKPIKRILYATDLVDCTPELVRIVRLTRPLRAEIMAVHIREKGDAKPDPSMVSKVWSRQCGCRVDLLYENADPDLPMADNLRAAIRRLKPSMVVMFTDRNKDFFQRLFYPSQAERMALAPGVPLMIMAKSESANDH